MESRCVSVVIRLYISASMSVSEVHGGEFRQKTVWIEGQITARHTNQLQVKVNRSSKWVGLAELLVSLPPPSPQEGAILLQENSQSSGVE